MRPAMMLLLRALVILGAVLAVISCGNAFGATLEPDAPDGFVGASDSESCNRMTLSNSWGTVPAAGGTISKSGTGYC